MTEKSSKYLISNLAEESEKLNLLSQNSQIFDSPFGFSDIQAWSSGHSPVKSIPSTPRKKQTHLTRRKFSDPNPDHTKTRHSKALSSFSKHSKLPSITPKTLTPRFSNNPNQFTHSFQSKLSLFSEELWNNEVQVKETSKESVKRIIFPGDLLRRQTFGKFVQLKIVNKTLDVEIEGFKGIKPRSFYVGPWGE